MISKGNRLGKVPREFIPRESEKLNDEYLLHRWMMMNHMMVMNKRTLVLETLGAVTNLPALRVDEGEQAETQQTCEGEGYLHFLNKYSKG
jgi:hypothetical protein